MSAAPVSVRVCRWADAPEALRGIRHAVFVVEQRVPESLEWDAADTACVHALAEDAAGTPVGCARLLDDGHIGRVAVVADWRGRGVGTALMRALIDAAFARGDPEVIVNSQVAAMPFYARHAFVARGDVFVEAGIDHCVMTRTLR